MRRTVVIMLIFCVAFCLCGCGADFESEVTVNEPADNSVNGYRLEQTTDNIIYYANTNSKKFHLSECGTANRIDKENLYITADRNELINQGYIPCKSCNP